MPVPPGSAEGHSPCLEADTMSVTCSEADDRSVPCSEADDMFVKFNATPPQIRQAVPAPPIASAI